MDKKYSRISPIVQCEKRNIIGVFYLRNKVHGFRKIAAQKRKHHSNMYTEVSDAALSCEYSIAGKSKKCSRRRGVELGQRREWRVGRIVVYLPPMISLGNAAVVNMSAADMGIRERRRMAVRFSW